METTWQQHFESLSRRCMPVQTCLVRDVAWTYVPAVGWVEPWRADRLRRAAKAIRGIV